MKVPGTDMLNSKHAELVGKTAMIIYIDLPRVADKTETTPAAYIYVCLYMYKKKKKKRDRGRLN